jgi:hypothetical protein
MSGKGVAMQNNKIHFLDSFLLDGSRCKFICFVVLNSVLALLIEHIWLHSLMAGSYGIEAMFLVPMLTWFALMAAHQKFKRPSYGAGRGFDDHGGMI